MEDAYRAKDEFFTNMTHEFRTPLNSILGYSQDISRENLTKKQIEALNIIHVCGNDLFEMINNLLDISKLDAGNIDIYCDEVDLIGLIENVLDVIKIQAIQKKIYIRLKLSADLPRYIRTNKELLRRILYNLLSNAIKFTYEGGVTFYIERRREGFRFEVRDTGVGISSKEINYIFKPFHQGHAKSDTKGTGLGLAICRKFVQSMGGILDVESELDRGSVFWFEVNLLEVQCPKDVDENQAPKTIYYDGQSKMIYIVGDAEDTFQSELLVPPQKDIGLLLGLIKRGRLKQVLMAARKFEEEKPAYSSFWKKVNGLAEIYHITQLCNFLENHLEEDKDD